MKHDDVGPDVPLGKDGLSEEVRSVGQVLLQHQHIFRMTYDYFSATVAVGNDIYSMSSNGWAVFIETCNIAVPKSKTCQAGHLDQVRAVTAVTAVAA